MVKPMEEVCFLRGINSRKATFTIFWRTFAKL